MRIKQQLDQRHFLVQLTESKNWQESEPETAGLGLNTKSQQPFDWSDY